MGLVYARGEGIKQLQLGVQAMQKGVKVESDRYLGLLADFLRDSIKEELGGGGADKYGFYWTGKLFNSIRKKNVSATEVDIIQNDEGLFTMYGTSPHPGADHPPAGLIEWAESKLGLAPTDAYPVALSIFRKGTLGTSRYHYPGGSRGFNYAEYVVEVKEIGLVTEYAEKIGSVLVQYLTTSIRP